MSFFLQHLKFTYISLTTSLLHRISIDISSLSFLAMFPSRTFRRSFYPVSGDGVGSTVAVCGEAHGGSGSDQTHMVVSQHWGISQWSVNFLVNSLDQQFFGRSFWLFFEDWCLQGVHFSCLFVPLGQRHFLAQHWFFGQ